MRVLVEERPRFAHAGPQRRVRGHDSPPGATKQPWAGKRAKYHDSLQKPAWTGRASGAASAVANLGISGWGTFGKRITVDLVTSWTRRRSR